MNTPVPGQGRWKPPSHPHQGRVRLAVSFSIAVAALGGCLRDRHLVGEDRPNDGGTPDQGTPGDDAQANGGGSVGPSSGGAGGVGGATTGSAGGSTVTSLGEGTRQGWAISIPPEEVALRLSRFLLRKTPPPSLTTAVVASAPTTNQDVGQLTEGLLLQEGSLAGRQAFYRWWLGLDEFLAIQRDPTLFPGFTTEVRQALIDQTMALAEDITWQPQGDLSMLLTEPAAFVTSETAPWFPGVVAPNGTLAARVSLDPARYAGLFTQPPVVARLDYSFRAAPVARGLIVRETYLCHIMPPVPPDERATKPFPDQTMTIRERLSAHTANAACAACHGLLDPLGFSLGHFDAIGVYHDTEGELPVDTSGNLIKAPAAAPEAFDGAPALAQILARLPEVRTCFAIKWLLFATGRETDSISLWSQESAGTNALVSDADYVVKRATIQGHLNLRGTIRAVTETHAFLDP